MNRLDGNVLAGVMLDVFGEEMTTATGQCTHCGATLQMAEAMVYLGGPGIVTRCPRCDNVLMVIVERRGIRCVDVAGLAFLGR
jgi:phage FluMu protein Com